jgi:hypothetical protein
LAPQDSIAAYYFKALTLKVNLANNFRFPGKIGGKSGDDETVVHCEIIVWYIAGNSEYKIAVHS